MAQNAIKGKPRKGYGDMQEPPDLLSAIYRMDFSGVKTCLDIDSEVIHQLDKIGNNAMHLCVGGGTQRMKHIMTYLLDHTDINLLHKNDQGRTPLQIAIAVNDQDAVELLYDATLDQMHAANPDSGPDLGII